MKDFTPKFTEEIDEEKLEYDWAMAEIKRHYKYIGFRKYFNWDSKINKWHKSIHFQFLDKFDYELIKWNTKKGLW
jgi:hypothetical protein